MRQTVFVEETGKSCRNRLPIKVRGPFFNLYRTENRNILFQSPLLYKKFRKTSICENLRKYLCNLSKIKFRKLSKVLKKKSTVDIITGEVLKHTQRNEKQRKLFLLEINGIVFSSRQFSRNFRKAENLTAAHLQIRKAAEGGDFPPETFPYRKGEGRNMKKKILSILLAGAMGATLLAGCGSNSSSTNTSKTKTEKTDSSASGPEDVELTVMTPSEDADEAQGNWIKTNCEAFAKANADKWTITFNYVQKSEGDAKDTVLQDPSAAADVFLFANDQIGALVDAGALAKLGGEAADSVKSGNSAAIAATVTYNGDIYAVPFTPNTWFMYYDKRVFSEDDVKDLDTMLSKGKVNIPLTNAWYLASFFAGNGCTFFGADGTDKDAGIDFSSEKATPVAKYLVNLVANPNFVKGEPADNIGGLGNGSVNALFDGNWDYSNIVKALGEENVGVAIAPSFTLEDGTKCQMKPFLGSKCIGVNATSKNPAAAVALAAYLGGKDGQQSHFDLRKTTPTNQTVLATDAVKADAVATVMGQVAADGNNTVQPLVSKMGSYWDAAANFGNSLFGADKDGNAATKVTADNAEEAVKALNDAANGSLVQ